jgi:hypothetical protein
VRRPIAIKSSDSGSPPAMSSYGSLLKAPAALTDLERATEYFRPFRSGLRPFAGSRVPEGLFVSQHTVNCQPRHVLARLDTHARVEPTRIRLAVDPRLG